VFTTPFAIVSITVFVIVFITPLLSL
jgi:hypothetical protein